VELSELVFNFLLPFLLFYVLFFALLEKTKILGEKARKFNAMVALSLSGIGMISIYSLGLVSYITWIIVGTMFLTFFTLFIYGILSYAAKKTAEYYTGEAFLTKEEKEFEAGKRSANALWEKLKEAIAKKDEERIKILIPQLDSIMKNLEELAPKLKKTLSTELPWYEEYKKFKGALGA
jgi:hypothetical protein